MSLLPKQIEVPHSPSALLLQKLKFREKYRTGNLLFVLILAVHIRYEAWRNTPKPQEQPKTE